MPGQCRPFRACWARTGRANLAVCVVRRRSAHRDQVRRAPLSGAGDGALGSPGRYAVRRHNARAAGQPPVGRRERQPTDRGGCMSSLAPPLDPITLEIIWNGLKSINDEAWITIQKSAFSTNIKERHDHSTAIADARGRLIAQAEMSLPIHLASLLELMRILVARYRDDIAEGDLFIANDPHVAGGTHLPDINMAMPVFADGRLVAFVSNLAHHADVGGA